MNGKVCVCVCVCSKGQVGKRMGYPDDAEKVLFRTQDTNQSINQCQWRIAITMLCTSSCDCTALVVVYQFGDQCVSHSRVESNRVSKEKSMTTREVDVAFYIRELERPDLAASWGKFARPKSSTPFPAG